ncbi:hypothetical protein, variant 1 [Aphanomyces astaci]|uniref:FH2 domain-containing protein n=1 Tax=Aphanomyces astaci TaxID=112090 RepID=W4GJA3_APHAT|nr:hypothetical protein, variant 1 [Aphanomyces astaci]ETV79003.1 hypothetical protein, variant 1 [Aphanomyces astaci]|eukprot:XP_009831722.1 hypothetical protein, variant 1 [Aphanomyces astaci]
MNPFRRWSGKPSKNNSPSKPRKDSFSLESPPSLRHEILEREPSMVATPALTRPSEPSQIDALFRDMMDKMPLSNAAADRMWALPINQKWQLVQEWSKKHEHERQHDSADRQPIFWVHKLQEVLMETTSPLTEDQARGLHVLMRGASKEWLHKFHRAGGVTSLCEYMAALAYRATEMADSAFAYDNAILLECLRCYKTLMSNPFGLELLLDSTDHHVDTLAQCLDFSHFSQQLVTTTVLEMLSVFCWRSERGQLAVLQAMGSYQRTHKERARFASLVHCLKASDSSDLHAACLTFINTIVSASPRLEDRVHVRNDFLALDLLVVCHAIQAKMEAPPSPPRLGGLVDPSFDQKPKPPPSKAAFVKQLRVFEGFMVSDMEDAATNDVDLTNLEAVFTQLKASASRYGFTDRLLNVLLAMMGIPGEATMGTKMWELAEESLLQITSLHSYNDLTNAPRQLSFEWVRELQDSVEVFQTKVDTIASLESTIAAMEAQSKRCHATVKARDQEIVNLKTTLEYVYAEQLKHQSIVSESTQTCSPAVSSSANQTDEVHGRSFAETQTDDVAPPTTRDFQYETFFQAMRAGTMSQDQVEVAMRAQGLDPAVLFYGSQALPPRLPPPLVTVVEEIPEKYLKLIKMGMPKEQVALKMKADGVDPSLLDTHERSTSQPRVIEPTIESPVGPKAPAPTNMTETYVKLLKIGIPYEQVALKMCAEGLDPGLLPKLTASPPSLEPPPVPPAATVISHSGVEKYVKLIKMGMPKEHVKIKMKADGVDPAALDAAHSSSPPPPTTTTTLVQHVAAPEVSVDPKHEKYIKLLKMGMPKEQVALKMKAEGLDVSVLDTPSVGVASEGPSIAPSAELLSPPPLDPKYTKYVKLLQMGMPLEQIEVKVKAEGLDPSKLTLLAHRTSPSPPPPITSSQDDVSCESSKLPPSLPPPVAVTVTPPPLPPTFKLPPKPSTVPTVKLRSLYWTPLPDAAVEGSIWLNLDETKLGLDLGILDKEFGPDKKTDPLMLSSSPTKTGKAISTTAKPKVVHLVDSKRQQNCSIALSRFRMAPKDIKAAIVALDDNVLTLERIQSLAAMVPTADEVDLVKGYEGDVALLGETEKFFLAISDLPRLAQRLKAMESTWTFGQRFDEVKGKLKLLDQAYGDLKRSTKLLSLLQVVLAVGNYLNGGTPRGGVYGFKLDILPKLSQVKATSSANKTLLHVIAEYVATSVPDASDFYESLNSLDEVSAISFTLLQNDVHMIEASLVQIDQEKPHQDDVFRAKMGLFLAAAQSDCQSLQANMASFQSKFHTLTLSFGVDSTKPTSDGVTKLTLLQL